MVYWCPCGRTLETLRGLCAHRAVCASAGLQTTSRLQVQHGPQPSPPEVSENPFTSSTAHFPIQVPDFEMADDHSDENIEVDVSYCLIHSNGSRFTHVTQQNVDIQQEDVQMQPEPPLPPKRTRRLPQRLRDMIPTDTIGIKQYENVDDRYHALGIQGLFDPIPDNPNNPPQRSPSPVTPFQTEPDEFGLYRIYRELPLRDPDAEMTISSVADAPGFVHEAEDRDPTTGFGSCQTNNLSWFAPFLSASVFRLFHWYYQSTSLSLASLNSLVKDVIQAPDFDPSDFDGFDAAHEAHRIDDQPPGDESIDPDHRPLPFRNGDIWSEKVVSVPLPPPPGEFYHHHCPNQQKAVDGAWEVVDSDQCFLGLKRHHSYNHHNSA